MKSLAIRFVRVYFITTSKRQLSAMSLPVGTCERRQTVTTTRNSQRNSSLFYFAVANATDEMIGDGTRRKIVANHAAARTRMLRLGPTSP